MKKTGKKLCQIASFAAVAAGVAYVVKKFSERKADEAVDDFEEFFEKDDDDEFEEVFSEDKDTRDYVTINITSDGKETIESDEDSKELQEDKGVAGDEKSDEA